MNREQMISDLMDVFRSFKRFMHEGVMGENLSMTHFSTLRFLGRSGPASMSQLAEQLDLTHGAVTGIVDRLETRGLVTRIHSQEDRRKIQVALTEDGVTLQQNLLDRSRERLERILDSIEPAEQDQAAAGIRLFSEAIKRYDTAERTLHAGK